MVINLLGDIISFLYFLFYEGVLRMLAYNQKVVPISKSVKSDLNHSPVWQRAKIVPYTY
ncbi:hypothetical protein SUNDANCE_149 [Brevibacillus phage Sundance]|uniref:hypothetical protein n=1 Tax=Brevibacillus phage Sundance TaxID=1691958 RepID=UPI0006BCD54D|nr:hypothetical protein AVT09_gp149 [Brevibacillus phage Sundance]ALA47965.1 hypothetical protein SUNDANCE_149 [Brevibacillus phage Sundance]